MVYFEISGTKEIRKPKVMLSNAFFVELNINIKRFSYSSKDESESDAEAEAASIFRLQAAFCALKLATVPEYENLVLSGLENLAWVMQVSSSNSLISVALSAKIYFLWYLQDPSWDSRNRFLLKLTTLLKKNTLRHGRYNAILFLSAHDPDMRLILTVCIPTFLYLASLIFSRN